MARLRLINPKYRAATLRCVQHGDNFMIGVAFDTDTEIIRLQMPIEVLDTMMEWVNAAPPTRQAIQECQSRTYPAAPQSLDAKSKRSHR